MNWLVTGVRGTRRERRDSKVWWWLTEARGRCGQGLSDRVTRVRQERWDSRIWHYRPVTKASSRWPVQNHDALNFQLKHRYSILSSKNINPNFVIKSWKQKHRSILLVCKIIYFLKYFGGGLMFMITVSLSLSHLGIYWWYLPDEKYEIRIH